jgi:tetratricopeptide (TPR) repeat protein
MVAFPSQNEAGVVMGFQGVRRAWALFLIASAAFVPGGAEARNPQHAKFLQMVRKGEALYRAGHYAEAAAALQQAYTVEADARVLYNIARAFDQASDLKAAVDYYGQYLAAEKTDPTLAQRASLSLDRLKGLIAKQDADAKRQADEQAQAEARAKAAQERAQLEVEAARKAQAEAEAQAEARRRAQLQTELASRRRMKIASLTVGGVSLGAAGLGVVFGVLANSSHNQFTQASQAANKDAFASTTRSRALVADVGYGASILALSAAILLYPKGKEPAAVTLVPAPGGLGLSVGF